MPVFISHSFEDKPEFDNIADALEQKGIEYWKPESLRAGAPLSDQLRQSIIEAEVCVFVATRRSVQSSWCGAELGAFWGAGKPVLIYIAEASLPEDELPKQFKGHLTERRISRVVEAAQKCLAGPEQEAAAPPPEERAPYVGGMTVEELRLLIAEVVSRTQDAAFVETALSRIALINCGQDVARDSPEYRELWELLSSLLSVAGTAVREGAKRAPDWKHTFSFSTDTGDWLALAQRWEDHTDHKAPIGYYEDCLALRLGAGDRVEAVAKMASLTEHDLLGIVNFSEPTLIVGRGTLGKIQSRINR